MDGYPEPRADSSVTHFPERSISAAEPPTASIRGAAAAPPAEGEANNRPLLHTAAVAPPPAPAPAPAALPSEDSPALSNAARAANSGESLRGISPAPPNGERGRSVAVTQPPASAQAGVVAARQSSVGGAISPPSCPGASSVAAAVSIADVEVTRLGGERRVLVVRARAAVSRRLPPSAGSRLQLVPANRRRRTDHCPVPSVCSQFLSGSAGGG